MNRRGWIVAAFVAGLVFFWLALQSTGAGHGSCWAIIAFYPLQFLAVAILHATVDLPSPETTFLLLVAALSLPWHPLVVAGLTSPKRWRLRLGICALVLQGLGAAAMIVLA